MLRLAFALLALFLLRADMYPDASNAALPQARANLGIGGTFSPAADHGAATDGTTDASAAIAASLADCAAAGGGVVSLGASRYRVASSITVPRFCELRGAMFPQSRTGSTIEFNNVPAIILDSSATINMQGSLSNLAIFRTGMVVPTDVRSGLAGVAAFAGTAITLTDARSVALKDLYIIGFNKCLDMLGTNNARLITQRIWCDATNGMTYNQLHDVAVVSDVFVTAYYTQNLPGAVTKNTVTAINDNGSGAMRLTLATPTVIATGDHIAVDGATGFQAVNNGWTATLVDSTHVDLQGSQFSPATTGTWVTGSQWVAVASTNSLGIGQTVAGAGVAVGSKIQFIDWLQKVIWLDTPTTGAGTAAALTFTNTALAGTVQTNLRANYRAGTAFNITNSEGTAYRNIFAYDHAVAFHLGTGAADTHFVEAMCDASGGGQDPTKLCLWIDQGSSGTVWNGGWISGYANQILVDHAGNGDVVNGVRFIGGVLGGPSGAAIASVKSGSVMFTGSGAGGSVALPLFISDGNLSDVVSIGNGVGTGVQLVFQSDLARNNTCQASGAKLSIASSHGTGCGGGMIPFAAASIAAGLTNYVVPGNQGTTADASTYNNTGQKVTLTGLQVHVPTAPGVGQTVTATLVYGAPGVLASNGPSCTIADTTVNCRCSTDGTSFGCTTPSAALDLTYNQAWSLKLTTSAGAAATGRMSIGLAQY